MQTTPPAIGQQWPEQDNFIYAGVSRGRDGEPDYLLLVHPDDKGAVNWNDATQWAADLGCALPSRAEQSLMFANVPELFEKDWYWSGEERAANPDFAWMQVFGDGLQDLDHKSYQLRARALRRSKIL